MASSAACPPPPPPPHPQDGHRWQPRGAPPRAHRPRQPCSGRQGCRGFLSLLRPLILLLVGGNVLVP
eukprot:4531340-Alexandrium_andersonii.AAC.1